MGKVRGDGVIMQTRKLALYADSKNEPDSTHVWCMLCGDRSKEAQKQSDINEWCLEHTGRSGHMRYRVVKEAYLVVGEAEGNMPTRGES